MDRLLEKEKKMATVQEIPSIKAFCIDFNWDTAGPAQPGLFGQADPVAHVEWYRALGANVIQTFCVSYNGYAWYKNSTVAPVLPAMTHDFLPEITELAHRAGMLCVGYFNLSSNPVWKAQHPEAAYAHRPPEGSTSTKAGHNVAHSLVYTDAYLDYFGRLIEDALRQTDIDGFMVDWLKPPERFGQPWLSCERQLYRDLMHRPLPAQVRADCPEILEYERCCLERAWARIRQAVAAVRPALVWTNHPFRCANDPLWDGHRVLGEADWILNESPDAELLGWLARQVGPRTRLIQNLCGWKDHDASLWKKIDFPTVGLYGFAQADPHTTLPSMDYTPACAANERNIGIIREAYHRLA